MRLARFGQTSIEAHPLWLAGAPALSLAFLLLPVPTTAGRLLLAAQPLLWVASVLAHEAAHAVTGAWLGRTVRYVALRPFGGVTAFDDELPSGAIEFWVSLAGPAASLLLAMHAAVASMILDEGPARGAAQALALFNVAVFGVNALPALPLDGGRVARAAFRLRGHDPAQAESVVHRIGSVCGYTLGGIALAALTLVPRLPGMACAVSLSLLWTAWVLVRGHVEEDAAVETAADPLTGRTRSR